MGRPLIDITGFKYGKLTVLKKSDIKDANGTYRWHCVCECGKNTLVASSALKKGEIKQCGSCYKIKHGFGGTPFYNTYKNMISRCYNASDKRYYDYGGRGISICTDWFIDIRSFYDWALANGYKAGLQINRIDNNGCYEPANCEWVTQEENSKNTRKTIRLPDGSFALDAARANGISDGSFYSRLRKGWSLEDAISTPKQANQFKAAA